MLGMLLWLSFYIPILPFRIHTWTSYLPYTIQRATLTLDQVYIPSYMSPGWLLRLKNIVRVSILPYGVHVLSYSYS